MNGFSLAAGKASPDLGVVMVSLSADPNQRIEIQRQVPHEVMHVLLYEKLGDGYENVPVWLDEGLASLVEGTPNPDYYALLQNALEDDALLPMESLCRSFRLEASLFYLSYAQSESFTRFLYDNFGSSGLEVLLEKYADGVECTRGPELALGQTLHRLELSWARELAGEVNLWQALQPLLPWLVLLAAMLGVPLLLAVGGYAVTRARPPRRKAA
jgi:hypothetical protein